MIKINLTNPKLNQNHFTPKINGSDSPSSITYVFKMGKCNKIESTQDLVSSDKTLQDKNIKKMIEISSRFNIDALKIAEKSGTPKEDVLFFSDYLEIYEERSALTPIEVQKTCLKVVEMAAKFDTTVLREAVDLKIPLESVLLSEEILKIVKDNLMIEID